MPEEHAAPDDSIKHDLIELVSDHPAATMLIVCAVLLFLSLAAVDAIRLNDEINRLQSGICTVLSTSGKGNAVEHNYWVGASTRATLRAAHETGSLRAIDLDSARNDTRIAQVFQPTAPINFPGCPT